jgi:hypothetical protein
MRFSRRKQPEGNNESARHNHDNQGRQDRHVGEQFHRRNPSIGPMIARSLRQGEVRAAFRHLQRKDFWGLGRVA